MVDVFKTKHVPGYKVLWNLEKIKIFVISAQAPTRQTRLENYRYFENTLSYNKVQVKISTVMP